MKKFRELKVGDVFKYSNMFYMKTSYIIPEYLFEYNAIHLECCVGESIDINTEVEEVCDKNTVRDILETYSEIKRRRNEVL